MTGPAGTALQDQVAVRPSSRHFAKTVLRVAGSVTALFVLYYLLPLDHASEPIAITMLVIGLAAFVTLVTFQVRWIIRSRFPGLRALEALAISIPLFLLLFASTYAVLADLAPGSFNQPMTHTNALYFTVTVFATVGFGDISAQTATARLLVTGQMMTDLIILGVGARVILGAVRLSRQRQPRGTGTIQPGD